MYNNTSAAYDKEVKKTSRHFVARLSVNNATVPGVIKTIALTAGSCGDSMFTFGCIFASYIDVVMSATDTDLAGKELYLEIGLSLPDKTVEYIPMGYFTVSPADLKSTRDQIVFKATDRISAKCGGVYVPKVTFPATVQAVINDIANQAGITIETALSTTGTIQTAMKGLLYREALGYIAGLLGGFCWCDRTGKIRISAYPTTTATDIPAVIIKDIQTAQGAYKVDTVMVKVSEDGTDADGNDVKGVSYIAGTGNGNRIEVQNPYMTQALFNAMKGRVLNYTYQPGTVQFLGDPQLEPMDAIKAYNYDGVTYRIPCMNIVHDFDGGLTTTITAPGQAASGSAVQGPLTQQISRMSTDILLAKQVIATKISADEVAAKYATIEKANILEANITTVTGDLANYKTIVAGDFTATNGRIDNLSGDLADYKTVVTQNFTAANGRIDTLSGDFLTFKNGDFADLSAKEANFETATANNFTAVNAEIQNIKSSQITTDYLIANFAKIDLANIAVGAIKTAMIDTGAVKTAQIADGSITDAKIVDLTANKITAGMLSVERLEIRGSENSIVYALNNITGALQAQNVDTLNGEILTERTITADKIVANAITAAEIAAKSITANEIAANTITAAEIMAQTITTQNLALDAIKSLNYVAGTSGSYLNLADGAFDSVYTKWDAQGKLTVKDITINNGRLTLVPDNLSSDVCIAMRYSANPEDPQAESYYTSINPDGLYVSYTQPGSMLGNRYANYSYSGITLYGGGHELYIAPDYISASGLLTIDGGIELRNEGGMWISGMSSTKCIVTQQNTEDSYFPILRTKTSSGHVFNIGGVADKIGFYGYYNGRTNNGYDWCTCWNVNEGLLYHSKDVNIDGALSVHGAINFYNTTNFQNNNVYGVQTLYFMQGTSGHITNYNNQQMYFAASSETNYEAFLGVRENGWCFCPNVNGLLRLGSPSYKWGPIYSTTSTITTSDRNMKEDFASLTEQHVKFFMSLKPTSYKYIDGTSGRTHIGYVAQDVEQAMKECGFTDLDFAGFCKDKKYVMVKDANGKDVEVDTGEYTYALRYEEFIPLNTFMVQKTVSEIMELRATINALIGEIAILKEKVGDVA